jgi:hypothetical protein
MCLIYTLIPTYVEQSQTKNNTDSYICVRVKNGFKSQFRMAQIFIVSHNSCEKLKQFAQSEAAPGFLDGVTTKSLVFFS